MAAAWRGMTPRDIGGVLHVAAEVHPTLPESAQVVEERVRLFPEGCLVLVGSTANASANAEADGNSREEDEGEKEVVVYGYAISHPIRRRHGPPSLDSLLGEVSTADADQFYIHDLAILPAYCGRGFAGKGVGLLFQVARRHRYATTCLVSVYGTAAFWQRFGFVRHAESDSAVTEVQSLGEKLRETYGEDAVYMYRVNRID